MADLEKILEKNAGVGLILIWGNWALKVMWSSGNDCKGKVVGITPPCGNYLEKSSKTQFHVVISCLAYSSSTVAWSCWKKKTCVQKCILDTFETSRWSGLHQVRFIERNKKLNMGKYREWTFCKSSVYDFLFLVSHPLNWNTNLFYFSGLIILTVKQSCDVFYSNICLDDMFRIWCYFPL